MIIKVEELIEQNKVSNRRFKCPECGEYFLHIENCDSVECEEVCDLAMIN